MAKHIEQNLEIIREKKRKNKFAKSRGTSTFLFAELRAEGRGLSFEGSEAEPVRHKDLECARGDLLEEKRLPIGTKVSRELLRHREQEQSDLSEVLDDSASGGAEEQ